MSCTFVVFPFTPYLLYLFKAGLNTHGYSKLSRKSYRNLLSSNLLLGQVLLWCRYRHQRPAKLFFHSTLAFFIAIVEMTPSRARISVPDIQCESDIREKTRHIPPNTAFLMFLLSNLYNDCKNLNKYLTPF